MAATVATLIIILIVNGELASCGNQVEIPCVTDFSCYIWDVARYVTVTISVTD